MRRIVALILFLTILFSFQPVHAQGGPSLSKLDVLIWPEYDQPSVLVIYHITVSPETTLPATMTFRIPAASVKPTAVALGQAVGQVSDQGVNYSVVADGDWVKVNIEVTAPVIQIEYYDPNLSKNGQSREFNYTWPGDYAVQSIYVELQQPYDASQLQTTPVLTDVTTEELTYHSGTFGALPAGKPFTLDIKYQKKTDSLSISFMPVDAPPVDSNTSGRVSLTTYLPWLIAGLGVLLITGGLYYYFRGQPRVKTPSRRRHNISASTEPSQGARYCPQCGTRARAGDRFCRTCGTRMRVGDEE